MACLNSKAQKEKGIASQPASEDRGGWGGGRVAELKKFCTPRGLTPYHFYAIFDRKGTPSVYLTLTNKTPLTYLVYCDFASL